jgi:hypothetical protein
LLVADPRASDGTAAEHDRGQAPSSDGSGMRPAHGLAGTWRQLERSRRGDLNPPSPCCAYRGPGRGGALTCRSPQPVVTAPARPGPAVPDAARTQRGPRATRRVAGSGPVRSRTPPALRSSATRDRSAGRARQGRSTGGMTLACHAVSGPSGQYLSSKVPAFGSAQRDDL